MIKKYLYMALGFACLGMAYVGVVVPGIPFSIFLVIFRSKIQTKKMCTECLQI